jgi:heme A synthase
MVVIRMGYLIFQVFVGWFKILVDTQQYEVLFIRLLKTICMTWVLVYRGCSSEISQTGRTIKSLYTCSRY